MKSPEILAPVGGSEQLTAAIRCGADAVYLGTQGFNARRNAENFESSKLSDVVSICHSHGVKVHVTVNTLVMDSEFSSLSATADEIAASGADAVIVQDLAVMELFLKKYPTIDVHASTQCAVTSSDGVKFFEDLGVKRVVLARELSIDEITKIRSETSCELEVFIHGALCMSVSGACYMSSMLGGRSGNRGLCAQPCRLNFKCQGREYALSLKDMSHISHVSELSSAGVSSFKIEGRMKRPEYVAAAVTALKNALDGKPFDEDTLKAVFSRGGFTDGYATGKRDDMFGHRSHEDVTAAEGVLKELSHLYSKERQRVPVDMSLTVGEESILSAEALGARVEVSAQGAIVPQKGATDHERAASFLGKLGGTQFYLSSLSFSNLSGLMLPPSVMNSMRREATVKLDSSLGTVTPHTAEPYLFSVRKYNPPETPELWVRVEDPGQLSAIKAFDRVIVPAEKLLMHRELIQDYGEALTAELPPVLFPESEDKIRASLELLAGRGLKSIYTDNIYGIFLGKKLGLTVIGGTGLNILNSRSLEIYSRLGLSAACVSFELSMNGIGELGSSLPRGYIVYGRLPLMRVRNCPARVATKCIGCNGVQELTDRRGTKFPLLCHYREFSTVLNSVPLHLGGKKLARCDFKLVYFTIEKPSECNGIIEEMDENRVSASPRTGGLYYRTLK